MEVFTRDDICICKISFPHSLTSLRVADLRARF
jgi:hypothetical protein